MKALTFNSDYFGRTQLDNMSDEKRFELAGKAENRFICNIYHSLDDFQEAFNSDLVSDQCYIYFINL